MCATNWSISLFKLRSALAVVALILLWGCAYQLKGVVQIIEPLRRLVLIDQARLPEAMQRILQDEAARNGIAFTALSAWTLEIVSFDVLTLQQGKDLQVRAALHWLLRSTQASTPYTVRSGQVQQLCFIEDDTEDERQWQTKQQDEYSLLYRQLSQLLFKQLQRIDEQALQMPAQPQE